MLHWHIIALLRHILLCKLPHSYGPIRPMEQTYQNEEKSWKGQISSFLQRLLESISSDKWGSGGQVAALRPPRQPRQHMDTIKAIRHFLTQTCFIYTGHCSIWFWRLIRDCHGRFSSGHPTVAHQLFSSAVEDPLKCF